MSPDHHLRRSLHFLDLAAADLDAGDRHRAAGALARSASHAVTAAAVHGRYPHNTRRRLHLVLSMLMFNGLLEYRHHRTFRHVYELPAILAGSPVPDGLRRLRRARRRVFRLTAAMDADPNPKTWYDPAACPKCAAFSALIASRRQSLNRHSGASRSPLAI